MLRRRIFISYYKGLTKILSCNNHARNYTTEKNIIKSKGAELNIRNGLVHDYIWNNLNRWPNKIAVECIETKRHYTYEQLHRNSLKITKFLRDTLKLNKQDVVAAILPNLPEYPIVIFGTLQAGLILTTCNPNYTPDEFARQLTSSKAKAIFTTSELAPVMQKITIGTNIPIVVINTKETTNINENCIKFKDILTGLDLVQFVNELSLSADNVAFLPYSSGTTGLPKGVQLTHSNITSNLHQAGSSEFCFIHRTEGNDQDIVPLFLPIFHIYGLVMVMLQSLALGSKLITIPKFSSNTFIKLLKEYRASVLFTTPPIVHMIINNSEIKLEYLQSIRTINSGAAPLGASDIDRFHEKSRGLVKLLQAYGMTETSPLTHSQSLTLANGIKIGGCGFLIPNTEAKIVAIDAGDMSAGLEPYQSGELLIRGPQVMAGYYNNEQANQDVFLDENWIRTGDIAHYDEDHHFFVTDRLKELIKVKGFQVAPAELEAILRQHPAVDDAAVIGVEHPQFGEAPKAFIVRKKQVDADQLRDYVASKVAKYKQLVGGVVFVDAIPKNPSGKILRRELKKQMA